MGIGFFFAPAIHAAMRHTAPVRADLKIRIAFNLLGPLTNPTGANAQLVGTPSEREAKLIAGALAALVLATRLSGLWIGWAGRDYNHWAYPGLRNPGRPCGTADAGAGRFRGSCCDSRAVEGRRQGAELRNRQGDSKWRARPVRQDYGHQRWDIENYDFNELANGWHVPQAIKIRPFPKCVAPRRWAKNALHYVVHDIMGQFS